MRKILWTFILVGGYVWLMTSGHDDIVYYQGKMLYKAVVTWFEDAEVDFQLKSNTPKKKSRRWD